MLKKIKKLIKNKFFLDDNAFELDDNLQCDNAFVLSNLGQLKQVDTMIRFENLKNNLIIIVYTEANLEMPNLILEQYDKDVIDNAILFKLPKSVNTLNIFKIYHLERIYKKILEKITIKNAIYLMSFEGHYAIFAHLAEEKNIRLDLIEEGTATYKLQKIDGEILNSSPVVNILGKTKFFLSFLPFFYDQQRLIFLSFDTIYAGFPEVLEKVFDTKNIVKYFAYSNIDTTSIENIVKSYNITKNDFVYVNQRYPINEKEFSSVILDILYFLVKDNDSRVFIKMHPKDTPSLIKTFQNIILQNQMKDKIIFITDKTFLIEPVISLVKPKAVLGLTSTSLVYSSLVSPKTKVVSIAPLFLKSVRNNIANVNGVKIIENHFSIMRNFKNIEIIETKEDIKTILGDKNIVSQVGLNSTQKQYYLDIAKEAYLQSKYLKATMYYEWFSEMDIETLSLKDKVDYLISIENIGNDQKLYSVIKSLFSSFDILENNIKNKILNSCLTLMNDMFIVGEFEKSEELEHIFLMLHKIDILTIKNIENLDIFFTKYYLQKLFLLEQFEEFINYYEIIESSVKEKFVTAYDYLKNNNSNKDNTDTIINFQIYLKKLLDNNKFDDILHLIEISNYNSFVSKRFKAIVFYEKGKYTNSLVEFQNIYGLTEKVTIENDIYKIGTCLFNDNNDNLESYIYSHCQYFYNMKNKEPFLKLLVDITYYKNIINFFNEGLIEKELLGYVVLSYYQIGMIDMASKIIKEKQLYNSSNYFIQIAIIEILYMNSEYDFVEKLCHLYFSNFPDKKTKQIWNILFSVKNLKG